MKEMNGQLRVLLNSLGFASERHMPVDKRFTNYAGEFLRRGRGGGPTFGIPRTVLRTGGKLLTITSGVRLHVCVECGSRISAKYNV